MASLFFFTAAPAQAAATACSVIDAGYVNCVRYTYSGANQTFVVPANVTSIYVKIWAGGGGGVDTVYWSDSRGGGGGGYVVATIAVTPGETLNLTVGQGGLRASNALTFGGGGRGGVSGSATYGGSGGGLSGIWRGTPFTLGRQLVIAGGGGGGSPGSSPTEYSGGGGGLVGLADASPNWSGRGGDTTTGTGGAAATGAVCSVAQTAGTQFLGGNGGGNTASSVEGGGGGGGGFWGGGGGRCQIDQGGQNGGGGGGSAYIAGVGVTNAQTYAGGSPTASSMGGVAAQNLDSQYVSGVGDGGSNGSGGNGLIVIQYNTTNLALVKSSSVVTDGISITNAKAIPNAVIRYCILTTNPTTSASTATSVVVTDTIAATLLYQAGSMRSGTTCANATTVEDDDATGTDETNPFGASISGNIITATATSLAVGSSFAITFDAKVK